MGAIAAMTFSLLQSGDHIITHTSLYSGTHKLFTEICPRMGITVSIIDSVDVADWQKALEDNPATRLVYVETPSNPRIELYDLKALAALAHVERHETAKTIQHLLFRQLVKLVGSNSREKNFPYLRVPIQELRHRKGICRMPFHA